MVIYVSDVTFFSVERLRSYWLAFWTLLSFRAFVHQRFMKQAYLPNKMALLWRHQSISRHKQVRIWNHRFSPTFVLREKDLPLFCFILQLSSEGKPSGPLSNEVDVGFLKCYISNHGNYRIAGMECILLDLFSISKLT